MIVATGCDRQLRHEPLTNCILGNFHAFCRLLIFFKITVSEKFFQEYYQNVKQSDQAQRIFGPDLGPNCLPKVSADDTGTQRVKMTGGAGN